jgi:3-oxoacyl-[acyl-carrier protein] reductase
MTQRPLAGMRALVTGGSRGIGAAIVRRLAAEGASVAYTYASSTDVAEKLRSELSGRGTVAVAIRADNADPAQVAAAVDETVARLGGLDALINSAGVDNFGPLESVRLEDFDRVVAINLRGAFVAIQQAVPHMRSGGRIIMIGSVQADRVALPGMSVYAMTKAAIAGLTRALARELGPRGITVNVIQPGPIATDANPETGKHADMVRNLLALGRYGHPDDVANAVAYLAGSQADFVSGATWNIDGGYV